jgi:hypothetical protein
MDRYTVIKLKLKWLHLLKLRCLNQVRVVVDYQKP